MGSEDARIAQFGVVVDRSRGRGDCGRRGGNTKNVMGKRRGELAPIIRASTNAFGGSRISRCARAQSEAASGVRAEPGARTPQSHANGCGHRSSA